VSVGVLFGGPTPEHDISILTGLLALHELERSGSDVVGIYWTKTGMFYSVPRGVEAEAFLDGLPKGSSELSLRLGNQGGFFASARMGKDRAIELEAVVLATHGGPGEDGSLQAALDLAGVSYTGPTVAGAALGMDKCPSVQSWHRSASPRWRARCWRPRRRRCPSTVRTY